MFGRKKTPARGEPFSYINWNEVGRRLDGTDLKLPPKPKPAVLREIRVALENGTAQMVRAHGYWREERHVTFFREREKPRLRLRVPPEGEPALHWYQEGEREIVAEFWDVSRIEIIDG